MERKQIIEDEDTFYVSCDALCVGDYGGAGSVGEANIRALEDTEGAHVRHGHYSSRQLWLPETEENVETVRSLEEDYPLYDDAELGEVEAEWEMEAWESWLRSDLVSTLSDELQEAVDSFEDGKLWELYREAMEKENEYPVAEYNGVHVPVKRISAAFGELVGDEVVFIVSAESGIPSVDSVPLCVLADWCEEISHPLTDAMRYLAAREQPKEV